MLPTVPPNTYTLKLPYPVSVNRMFKYRGSKQLSDEAIAYKWQVLADARNQGVIEPIQGRVGVNIQVFPKARRGDLDNLLKLTLDSLNDVAWKDDRMIDEIVIQRRELVKEPYIILRVWKFLGAGT